MSLSAIVKCANKDIYIQRNCIQQRNVLITVTTSKYVTFKNLISKLKIK